VLWPHAVEVVRLVNGKYLGRNIRLRKAREELREVRYLNEQEFKQMLAQIEDETIRMIHIVAFATGMRIGEVFAIRPSDIHNGVLNVTSQIDRERTRRITKNRKPRKTLILSQWIKDVKSWAAVPLPTKLQYRNLSFSKITKTASRKAFPRDSLKHCVFHDLRNVGIGRVL